MYLVLGVQEELVVTVIVGIGGHVDDVQSWVLVTVVKKTGQLVEDDDEEVVEEREEVLEEELGGTELEDDDGGTELVEGEEDDDDGTELVEELCEDGVDGIGKLDVVDVVSHGLEVEDETDGVGGGGTVEEVEVVDDVSHGDELGGVSDGFVVGIVGVDLSYY